MYINNEEIIKNIKKIKTIFEEIRAKIENVIKKRIKSKLKFTQVEREIFLEEIYQHLWNALYTFDPKKTKKVMSWLLTIVDNKITDYYRKYFKNQIEISKPIEELEKISSSQYNPEKEYYRKLSHLILIDALSRISSPRRLQVLLLFYFFEDISYEDIAKILKLPNALAARQLKYNALKELRKIIKEMGYEEYIRKYLCS